MVKIISKETLIAEMEANPPLSFAPDFDIRKVTRQVSNKVSEFIGTGDFAQAFHERRIYEVDAGRDQNPILYTSFYDVVRDTSLPQVVVIYRLGPAGVVLEEIQEGGEVKFVRIDSSEISVTQRHFGFGLEYSKDIRIFNQTWNVGIVERQGGQAYNALMNHLHFFPILDHTYSAPNTTNGTALTTFRADASMPEKYLRAVEDAITKSMTDPANPRRGPYDLLISSHDLFAMERALTRVGQQGFDAQSSALGRVQNIIAYDGWGGVRGKKSVNYGGVPSGVAFLIHKGNREEDWKSMEKQPLELTMGNPDVSRFIEEQMIWDTYIGLYANPTAAAHKITLPTASSGVPVS